MKQTDITGNISNLKPPCALNALEMADVEQNSDAGDAVATVEAPSIVTTVIVALGGSCCSPSSRCWRASQCGSRAAICSPPCMGACSSAR